MLTTIIDNKKYCCRIKKNQKFNFITELKYGFYMMFKIKD